MRRSRPKKVFYNRRYKLPGWAQVYAVWGVVALVTLVIVFFTSVEKVDVSPAAQFSTQATGFADSLFYDLRDNDETSPREIIREHASQLKKSHALQMTDSNTDGCRTLTLAQAGKSGQTVVGLIDDKRPQVAFFILSFYDRIARSKKHSQVAVQLVFQDNRCDRQALLADLKGNSASAVIIVENAASEPRYERVMHLKNLGLRRHFSSAFFMPENTLWSNTLALIGTRDDHAIYLRARDSWLDSPSAMLKANPLWRHMLAQSDAPAALGDPAAIYLSSERQLMPGGFIVLTVLFFSLALLPLVNALGTFRERLELGSALTSGVLYGIAFLVYYALFYLVQSYAKSDWLILVFACALLPLVFFPVRLLQKSVLSVELNRAGIHALIYILSICAAFVNVLAALGGLVALQIFSAFSRATVARKALRLLLAAVLVFLFYWVAKAPLGSMVNYVEQLLPRFAWAEVIGLLLFSLISGNLISLLFVPRERV